jgi:hypothetical protein
LELLTKKKPNAISKTHHSFVLKAAKAIAMAPTMTKGMNTIPIILTMGGENMPL